MPSCLRTVLAPPSQPTMYAARIVSGPESVCERRRDAARVLDERRHLAAEANGQFGTRLGDRSQQRFERVLRDQLIGFERAAVVVGRDRRLGGRHRRIWQMHDRFGSAHRIRQEHVHRRFARQACVAHGLGDAQAAEDLHRAGVAALHLRELNRCRVALDQRRAHAALREIEREREADRPGADDENLRILHVRHLGRPGW